MIQTLVVQVDGTAEIREIEPTLEAIKGVVGGWLEAIHPGVISHGNWHAYVDEEGKLKGAPFNEAGTALAYKCGWMPYGDILCGPVMFLGSNGPDEADVPIEVVAVATQIWGLEQNN